MLRARDMDKTGFSAIRLICCVAVSCAISGCQLLPFSSQSGVSARSDYARLTSRQAIEQATLPGNAIVGGDDAMRVSWPSATLASEFQELVFSGSASDRRQDSVPLQKWTVPVRIVTFFDDSVPRAIQEADRRFLLSLALRLEHFTGHPVKLVESRPNMRVFVMNEAKIANAGTAGRTLAARDRSQACTFKATSGEPPESGLKEVSIYIRSELPERLRHRCYRQQMTRGMGFLGVSGDISPTVLSTIDAADEFTSFDDLMLRMLYDPRLKSGMTRSQARLPIHDLSTELGLR